MPQWVGVLCSLDLALYLASVGFESDDGMLSPLEYEDTQVLAPALCSRVEVR